MAITLVSRDSTSICPLHDNITMKLLTMTLLPHNTASCTCSVSVHDNMMMTLVPHDTASRTFIIHIHSNTTVALVPHDIASCTSMSAAHDNMTMALVPHNIASCTSLHHVRLLALLAGSFYPNLGRVLLLNELAISKHVWPNILKLSKRKLEKSDLALK